MQSHRQGRTRPIGRWIGLTITGWVLLGCTVNLSVSDRYPWPGATAVAIWAVEPSAPQVLGFTAESLTIRWNVAVPDGVEAAVSLRLVPEDANLDSPVLVSGIRPVRGGSTDEWVFSGRDANGTFVPARVYQVEYAIDDGGTTSRTATSTGTITVPLRFTSPAEDTEIDLGELQTDGFTIEWEWQDFGAETTLLHIGLSVDPNVDPNDSSGVLWVEPNSIIYPFIATTSFTWRGEVFDGTDLDGTDANSQDIQPNTYAIIGRIRPAGTGPSREGFFFLAPGRLAILPDPNA